MTCVETLLKAYVGTRATITNPDIPSATWTGKVVAGSMEPCFLIETDDGQRLMLPVQWVESTELENRSQ